MSRSSAFYVDRECELNDEMRRTFYPYFDLSNEHLFLADHGRVSDAAVNEWRDGITGNVNLPAFNAARRDLSPHLPEDFFKRLRMLIEDALPEPKVPPEPLDAAALDAGSATAGCAAA